MGANLVGFNLVCQVLMVGPNEDRRDSAMKQM
jgi:hypothetical protein